MTTPRVAQHYIGVVEIYFHATTTELSCIHNVKKKFRNLSKSKVVTTIRHILGDITVTDLLSIKTRARFF